MILRSLWSYMTIVVNGLDDDMLNRKAASPSSFSSQFCSRMNFQQHGRSGVSSEEPVNTMLEARYPLPLASAPCLDHARVLCDASQHSGYVHNQVKVLRDGRQRVFEASSA